MNVDDERELSAFVVFLHKIAQAEAAGIARLEAMVLLHDDHYGDVQQQHNHEDR